jgi:hypothetical protein
MVALAPSPLPPPPLNCVTTSCADHTLDARRGSIHALALATAAQRPPCKLASGFGQYDASSAGDLARCRRARRCGRNTQQRSCTFPGVMARCAAPSGSAIVEWREQNGTQGHQLFLRGGSGVKSVLIHQFARSVDVLWSPDGRALAITDHAESTDSSVWVIKLDAPNHPANVESALKATFGAVPDVYRNGHPYFQANAWRSRSVVEFAIRAYDAAPNSEYAGQFLYRLNGTLQRR